MKKGRFNYESRGAAGSPPARQEDRRLIWIPAAHTDKSLFRNSVGKRQRRIFAVISPPLRLDRSRKPIRRVLIFDNHPESLRLISRQYANRNRQPGLRPIHRNVILSLFLVLILAAAMFWPLLSS